MRLRQSAGGRIRRIGIAAYRARGPSGERPAGQGWTVYDRERTNGDGDFLASLPLLSPSLSALWLNYTPEMGLLRFMSPAFTYTPLVKKGGKGHKVSVMLGLVRDRAVWAIAHCHCPPLSLDPPSTCCKEGQPYQGSHRCNNI